MTSESSKRSQNRSPDEQTPALQAEILEHDGRLDECTIFPRDADEEERQTQWIAALEGSYLDASEFR